MFYSLGKLEGREGRGDGGANLKAKVRRGDKPGTKGEGKTNVLQNSLLQKALRAQSRLKQVNKSSQVVDVWELFMFFYKLFLVSECKNLQN